MRSKRGNDDGGIELLARWRRTAYGETRADVRTYRGVRFLNVRFWYRPEDGGELRPTRKGITVQPEDLGALAAAVTAFAGRYLVNLLLLDHALASSQSRTAPLPTVADAEACCRLPPILYHRSARGALA